jgi:hypothetical protein
MKWSQYLPIGGVKLMRSSVAAMFFTDGTRPNAPLALLLVVVEVPLAPSAVLLKLEGTLNSAAKQITMNNSERTSGTQCNFIPST